MKILHISDTHSKLQPLCSVLTEHYPDHTIVHTGDITHRGTEEELTEAYTALRPLQARLLFVPGNHDYSDHENPVPGITYSDQAARSFDVLLSAPVNAWNYEYKRPQVNVYGDDHVYIIGLNSCIKTEQPFDFACGEIGPEQRHELQYTIKHAREFGARIVVALHHHPFMRPEVDYLFPFMRLRDAKDVLRILAYKVDVLLFGHKHISNHWTGLWGIPHVLAASATPQDRFIWDIEITKERLHVSEEYWRRYFPGRISA